MVFFPRQVEITLLKTVQGFLYVCNLEFPSTEAQAKGEGS